MKFFLVSALTLLMALSAEGNVVKRSDYSVPSYGDQPAAPVHHAQPVYDHYPQEPAKPFGDFPVGLLPTILIPPLLILGLSLLFTGRVTVDVRKKRSVEGTEVSAMDDLTTRINNIFFAVMESEECMQRIICEAGGVMKDVTAKDSLFTLVSKFAPGSIKKYLQTFKEGAYSKDVSKCQKIKCGIMS